MAKAKKEKTEDDFFNSGIMKKMAKDYGGSFAIPMDGIEDKDVGVIRTKPSLDLALSGGLQLGQLVQISGPPKTGKTTLAFEIGASFSKQYPEKKIFYYKVEGRLSSSLVDSIDGINKKNIIVIRSTIDKILSGTDYLKIFELMMRENPGSMHIIDSIAGIVSDAEMSANMDDQQMGDLPKLLAKLCRRNSNVIGITNSLVVSLNQSRASMNTKAVGFAGGNHWKHQLDTDLRVSLAFPKSKIEDSDGNQIGHNLSIEVFTTTLGPPKRKAILPLIYGRGIPLLSDMIKVAIDAGIVVQSSSWFEFNGDKVQGQNKLEKILTEDKEKYNALASAVEELIYGDE